MTPSPQSAKARPNRKEDLVYQVVTVVAMMTMLATAWIF